MRGGRFGRGYGMGRGRGMYGWGRGAYAWPGNPYPYCRNFPWLPRGWWWTGAYGTGYPGWFGYGPVRYTGYQGYPYTPVPYQTQQKT